jgi:hypothetical protein
VDNPRKLHRPFRTTIAVANLMDTYEARDGSRRRLLIEAEVGTGEMSLVLPPSLVESLGLRRDGFEYGRTNPRERLANGCVELFGRCSVIQAVVDPGRTIAALGWIVLDDLDLLVDIPRRRIYPRDPEMMTWDV